MSNSTDIPAYGWVESADSRVIVRILPSCGTGMILCCWVSVYPKVGSLSDKRYHQLLDEFNLFYIARLGPDLLFETAFDVSFTSPRENEMSSINFLRSYRS
ncbi:hypothetical protein PITC_070560 [Penicillium italicum]|uniref:Uncharacterized protein n=1 Tax=Penicillium italicum TaxID=40296 RepID=A0A0A2KNG8_PENIT|nr:hypothetical protein PITC_070560 [Penicillium italicum]